MSLMGPKAAAARSGRRVRFAPESVGGIVGVLAAHTMFELPKSSSKALGVLEVGLSDWANATGLNDTDRPTTVARQQSFFRATSQRPEGRRGRYRP